MIMVTGASGNVGSEVITALSGFGTPCVAASRRDLWANNPLVHHRSFDFTDPTTFDALEGCDSLFLVRPPKLSNVKRDIAPFLTVCRDRGVRKVVYLSVVGVDKLPFIPHYRMEREIERHGFDYTFIRAGFFMQNLSTTHAEEIRERSEIVVPCGGGRTTFVHVRDVAAVSAKALTGEVREERLTVVGADTLSYSEVCDKLTRGLGRPIAYRDASIPSFLLYRLRRRTPLGLTLVMVGIYLPTRFGKAEVRGVDVSRHLGRPPISFDQFLDEARSVWMARESSTP